MELGSSIELISKEGLRNPNCIKNEVKRIVKQLNQSELKIIDLVKAMDSLLTNVDFEVRRLGLNILSDVIPSLSIDLLDEKEIRTISEFIFLKMVDHSSMEILCLKCLTYFVDCRKKPKDFNDNILEFFKTKVNVRKLTNASRSMVYDIVMKILKELPTNKGLYHDLVYSILHVIEDEHSPDNILRCFKIVSFILKNFDILPYIDDIFDWLSSYFPIDYTPEDTAEDPSAPVIQRSELVEALYECFYCNPSNSNSLQTLLLSSVESNVMATKIESFECLIKCYEVFPLENIKDFSRSVWSTIRMQCLQKPGLVDQKILDLSYKTLTALSTKLMTGDGLYFNFIADMYDELSIAFRNPEMDLYESAIKLLVSVAKPQVSGFNFIIDNVLPVSIKAISSGEYRPVSGLENLFHQFYTNHPHSELNLKNDENIDRLASLMIDNITKDHESGKLLYALLKSRVKLSSELIDHIIKVFTSVQTNTSRERIEDCLVCIFSTYKKYRIIFDDDSKDYTNLSVLLSSVDIFEVLGCDDNLSKLHLYLHHIIQILDIQEKIPNDSTSSSIFGSFLTSLRGLALKHCRDKYIVHKIRDLHFIILNKIDETSLTQVAMAIFSSDYCQSLIPTEKIDNGPSSTYLEILKGVMKGLVLRNSKLHEPMINLVLNFLTSEKLSDGQELESLEIFSFVQSDSSISELKSKYYRIFPYYKQKLFANSMKEAKTRYDKSTDDHTKALLVCSIAFQLRYLNFGIYKRDIEWLMREQLRILMQLKGSVDRTKIISQIIECIKESLWKELKDKFNGLLKTIIDVCLFYSKESKLMEHRRLALLCLAKVTDSFDDSDLLIFRQSVVHALKICLADRKRLVRQAAATARLRWILVGQPIG